MNTTIEVVVDPQGNIRLQTRGFTGPTCRQASAALEVALAGCLPAHGSVPAAPAGSPNYWRTGQTSRRWQFGAMSTPG